MIVPEPEMDTFTSKEQKMLAKSSYSSLSYDSYVNFVNQKTASHLFTASITWMHFKSGRMYENVVRSHRG